MNGEGFVVDEAYGGLAFSQRRIFSTGRLTYCDGV